MTEGKLDMPNRRFAGDTRGTRQRSVERRERQLVEEMIGRATEWQAGQYQRASSGRRRECRFAAVAPRAHRTIRPAVPALGGRQAAQECEIPVPHHSSVKYGGRRAARLSGPRMGHACGGPSHRLEARSLDQFDHSCEDAGQRNGRDQQPDRQRMLLWVGGVSPVNRRTHHSGCDRAGDVSARRCTSPRLRRHG